MASADQAGGIAAVEDANPAAARTMLVATAVMAGALFRPTGSNTMRVPSSVSNTT